MELATQVQIQDKTVFSLGGKGMTSISSPPSYA